MKVRVEISDYINGRYNSSKLDKLKSKLEEKFHNSPQRQSQNFPQEGILVKISMSAKYQTPYIKCSEWGSYQSVGEFEEIIKESLEERGFESVDTEWEEDCLIVGFE